MKGKLILFLIFWVVCWTCFAQGYDEVYGESVLRSQIETNRSPQVWNVPISIKHVRDITGYSEVSQQDIYDDIEAFNEASQWVKLVIIEYVEIIDYDDDWYEINDAPGCGDMFRLRDAHTNYEALNSFVVGYVNSCSTGNSLCGFAYYPSGDQYNWSNFLAAGCVESNNSTYAHEWGHNFDLKHCHDGGDELIDGSNCETSGDDFCDTPASPSLWNGNVTLDCEYAGTATDDSGMRYDEAEANGYLPPDPTNLMQWGRKSCRVHFSDEQQLAMEAAAEYYCQTLNCESLSTSQNHIRKFTVTPNPFNDYIKISSKVKYKLYDLTGKLLNYGFNDIINTESLEKGVYILNLEDEVVKIVK